MSRKNMKVATAENGKTTLVTVEKTNVPTGKVKTLKNKEEIRKAREEAYKNFRISALKRRAKRMGLSEEETQKKVEELIKQMNSSMMYHIICVYNKDNAKMIREALLKDSIAWLVFADTYCIIEGDSDLLKDLRELMPQGTKIWPHALKKPPILPSKEVNAAKSKAKAKRIGPKTRRKTNNNLKAMKKLKKKLLKASNGKSGTVIQMKGKKPSNSLKKTSTLKKAA